MSDGPKPIEGHLLALGIDPAVLTDDDRRAIAEQVVDALLLYGNGYLARVEGRLTRLDPRLIQLHMLPPDDDETSRG